MKDPVNARNSHELFGCLLERMKAGESMALATVIARTGSGPREPGASLLICADGEMRGTVGGGALEAQVIVAAQAALREGRSLCREFVLTANQASDSGMICGGRMEILIDYWDGADTIRRDVVSQAMQAYASGRSCRFIRSLRHVNEGADRRQKGESLLPFGEEEGQVEGKRGPKAGMAVQTGLGLWKGDDLMAGSLDLSGLDREFPKKKRRRQEAALTGAGEVRYFVQPMGLPDTVFIFGAGHIAQALAPLCRFADFKTVIIDDRADFACRERFPEADGILVPASFEESFNGIETGPDSYVVIVTRGHAHDRTVLARALRTGAGYIGMIGSRRKRDAIYQALLSEGVTRDDLARVHCPIGLTIGAKTPEEIAISIVAELIAVRSACCAEE